MKPRIYIVVTRMDAWLASSLDTDAEIDAKLKRKGASPRCRTELCEVLRAGVVQFCSEFCSHAFCSPTQSEDASAAEARVLG